MFGTTELQVEKLIDIVSAGYFQRSNKKPSQWAEEKRVSPAGSAIVGPWSFKHTPYAKEILDRLSPDDSCRVMGIKKSGQGGISANVIENGIGWIMDESPAPVLTMVGDPENMENTMKRIDEMIDNSGLRPLISSQSMRARNTKTGDTGKNKEFPFGELMLKTAKLKAIQQFSVKYGFLDDYDRMKSASNEEGALETLILQRFAAYSTQMKAVFISTPGLATGSNIEEVFRKGDQRYWHIHCEHCHQPISLKWEIKFENSDDKAGMHWGYDNHGRLDEKTVCYICQLCGKSFTDKNKYEFNNNGLWIPSVVPNDPSYTSYQLNNLVAPVRFFSWVHLVRQYLDACPPDAPRNEKKYQVFLNQQMGECYHPKEAEPTSELISGNIRNYEIGFVPEQMSIQDGNGEIVLLTCAADMNGLIEDKNGVDDARLDYEIKAWTESGSSYSIMHGSIGTFVKGEGQKKEVEDREKWSYQYKHPRCVWPVFDELLQREFKTDTGKVLKIALTALDCGNFTKHAYAYLDNAAAPNVIGVKGKDADRNLRVVETPRIRQAKERPVDLYLVEVGLIKDDIFDFMQLKWNPNIDTKQPQGFMNFPSPQGRLYSSPDFFQHYESEHRIITKNKNNRGVSSRWEKKNSAVHNHMWDCAVYNFAARHIFLEQIRQDYKVRSYTWKDYVNDTKGLYIPPKN